MDLTTYTTGSGGTVRLGAVLGRGGEGTVHAVHDDQRLAAKIYLPGLAAERAEKIAAMIAAGLHAAVGFVAFPVDTLHDASGAFVGFTMRRVGGHKPVHRLYSPTDRKRAFPRATYPLLVRAALNLARAVAGVHAAGVVIGDINHSGVLVADDATVVLIDSDSFQIVHEGRLYPCKVGVPEFTPPELQGASRDSALRTPLQDAFGLAVLVFYTLVMGRHPFAGRYLGPGDMPMPRAIAEFRFAYSARRGATRMEPPPYVPTLADLPLALADAFERAFGPIGPGGARPSAAEWVGLLEQAEASLIVCSVNPAHHHVRTAPSCPWCRMEQAYPGFQAFAPSGPAQPTDRPIDLRQLVEAVRGVADPGPAPALGPLMPVMTDLRPQPGMDALRRQRTRRWALALVVATAGVALLGTGGFGMAAGVAVLAAGAALGWRAPASLARALAEAEQGRLAWRQAEEAFRQAAGNDHFRKLRRDAEAVLRQLQDLATEERRRLEVLATRRREAQLRRHLERFSIERMQSKRVGPDRKLLLRSYGIETAADIDYRRIAAIQGFGPSIAWALVSWRRAVEAKFRFDPDRGVNPFDIATIHAGIAPRQGELEARLHLATAALQRAGVDAVSLRTNPGPATLTAWTAWRQAEVDAEALTPSAGEQRWLVALAAGCVVLGVAAQVGPYRPPTLVAVAPPARLSPPPAAPPAPLPAAPVVAPAGAPGLAPPAVAALDLLVRGDAGRVQQRLKALGYFGGPVDGLWLAGSRAALRGFRRRQGLGEDDRWDARTEAALMAADAPPAGSAAAAATDGPDVVLPPPSGTVRNPLNAFDARWAQGRLRDLGFYDGDTDGVWDDDSRAALQDFKLVNGLAADEAWDGETERRLTDTGPVPAEQSFVGHWAANPRDCHYGAPTPVTISSRGAVRPDGTCSFTAVTPESGAWRAAGRCIVKGQSRQADIRLIMNGNTLLWSDSGGVSRYFRCH